MTRQYVVDEVRTWRDLIIVCQDIGCDVCDDVCSDEYVDGEIERYIYDNIYNYGWRDIQNYLHRHDDGYEYYIDSDTGWIGVCDGDDTFDDYKDNVLTYGDDYECWEEEDEDNADDEYTLVDDSPVFELEDFSIDELMCSCKSTFDEINASAIRSRQEEDESFASMLMGSL